MKNGRPCDVTLYDRLRETAYGLKKTDLVAAAKVMAEAFSDDASIRYLLGGETVGSNDWIYFLCVLKAIYGKCVMLSADERVNELLILFPPGLEGVPTVPFLLNGGAALYRTFGIGLFLRSLNYENNCKAVKKRFVTENTWYCMCFVVSPGCQGQGIGSKLIKPVLNILEKHQAPLYLETHKEINVSIYEHLGLETVEVSKIPGTDITQHSMMSASALRSEL